MGITSTAGVLIVIAGLGGAVGGAFTFNAPWWACFLFAIYGALVGLVATFIVTRYMDSGLEKDKELRNENSLKFFAFNYVVPFLAVVLVSSATVFSSMVISQKFWPDRAAIPRSWGEWEEQL